MPKVLIRGFANEEHYDATPCLCVDLTPEMAKQCLDRIKVVAGLKEADDSVYSLDYWNCDGEFFDMYRLDEEVIGVNEAVEDLENEEIVTVNPGTPLWDEVTRALKNGRHENGAHIRTETNLLEVTHNGVLRCGYVKHTNIRLESVTLYDNELGKFAGGLEVKEVDAKD